MKAVIKLFLVGAFIPLAFEFGNLQLTIGRIVLVFLGLLWLVHLLGAGGLRLKRLSLKLVIPLLVLLAYGAFLAFGNPYFERSIVDLLELGLLIFAILLLFNYPGRLGWTEKDSEETLHFLFFLSCIGSLVTIYGFFTTTRSEFGAIYRPHFLGDPSFVVLASYLYFRVSRKPRHFFLLLIAFISIIFLLTRGVWLTLALVFMVGLIVHRRYFLAPATLFLLSLTIIGIFISLLFEINPLPGSVISRINSLFTGNENLFLRTVHWQSSIETYRNYPLGTGLGTWRFFNLNPQNPVLTAHSDWFTLLAETGLVGIISLFWFWVTPLVALLKKPQTGRSVGAVIAWGALLSTFFATFRSDTLLTADGLQIAVFLFLFYTTNLGVQRSAVSGHAGSQAAGSPHHQG